MMSAKRITAQRFRTTMLYACTLLLFALCTTTVNAQLEEAEKKKNFALLKPGLTEAQVKKLVGNPELVEKFKTLQKGTKDTTTYWRYENDQILVFKSHVLEKVERDHNALLQRIQEWADPRNKDGIKLLYK